MKVVIRVGRAVLDIDGLALTRKEIRRLFMDVAGVAAAMDEEAPEPEKQPFGLTAHVELEPQAMPEPPGYDDVD